VSGLSIKDCRNPWVLLATGFGSGFSPAAPGTAGSLLAVPMWWWLLAPLSGAVQMVLLVLGAGLSVLVVERVRRHRVGDDQAIVLDEMLGTCIALCAAPRHLGVALTGFALFRLFDIAKPWPVSWAERRLPGGWGIVMDDVVAGVLAACVLELSLAGLRAFGASVGT